MKYKKGDKVEVLEFISSIAAGCGAKIGDIGVIDIASNVGDGVPYFVKLDTIDYGTGLWFREDGIKLVEEKIGVLKSGDKVILTNSNADNAKYHNLKEGIKGVVKENDGGHYKPILVDFEYETIWLDAGDLQLDTEVNSKTIEAGDVIIIVSRDKTQRYFGLNESMFNVGDCFVVDRVSEHWCNGEKYCLYNNFFYHIDDLVLLRKANSEIIESSSLNEIEGVGYLECVENPDFAKKSTELNLPEPTTTSETPVESDGGSSSYYFTKLPDWLLEKIVESGGIEIKDIVRHCFDNDADCKDIIKALKRIIEARKGVGKKGSDAMYNARKVVYFANELLEDTEVRSVNIS